MSTTTALCLVVTALVLVHGQEDYDSAEGCTTPLAEDGICIPINKCPSLYARLRSRDPATLSLLRKSTCGEFQGNIPSVCCPDDLKKDSTTQVVRQVANPYAKFPVDCGFSSAAQQDRRIIGGDNAALGAWPWMVVLGFRKVRTSEVVWDCGGTLITDRHVLTAAHCIKRPSWSQLRPLKVRLGELNLDPTVKDGATPVDINIDTTKVHEGYSTTTGFNDIAILRLKDPVKFTRHIQPACLPIGPEVRSRDLKGLVATTTGWGKTSSGKNSDALQQVTVSIVDNKKCAELYGVQKVKVVDTQMCAGDINKGGKDACQGDSGGPMVWSQDPVKYYLIGVVSTGIGCANASFPGIYTRLDRYLDWIHNNID